MVFIVHRQRLYIERCALIRVGYFAGVVDQRLEFLVAPAGIVLAAFHCIAAEQRGEEVVRVAVVACPAGRHHVGLALLGPAQHFGPFHHADVDFQADLGQVGLKHLGAQLRVGVGRAAAVAGEQGQYRTLRYPGFLEQGAGLVEVAGRVLVGGVVAHQRWRIRVDADQRIAFAKQLVDVGLAVEGHVDGFAYTYVAQVFVLGVERDVTGGQGFHLGDFQLGVVLDAGDVVGLGIQRHLAFVGLELLQAHIVVAGDGEDQRIGRWLAAEVVGVGLVADLGVLDVALENERAGADRFAVEFGGLVGLEQLVAVLGGIDRGEGHGQVRQERRFRAGEGEDHGVIVGFLDALEQVLETHALEIREADAGLVVPRVVRVQLASETPQHVVGIHLAGRREVVGGVELHPFAQMEGVGQAVVADLPAFGQGRLDGSGAGLEVDQAVEHGFGRCVGGYRGGVLDDIEAFRAGLGTHHQRLGREARRSTQQDGCQGSL
ncbi:hypothetical protein D3C78_513590 [compost metagenome]